MDEEDTMDLLKISDYISIEIENFKKAMNIFKLGGNQGSVHDMFAETAATEDNFARYQQTAQEQKIWLAWVTDLFYIIVNFLV